MALEQRFMFDAAGVATATDPAAAVQPDIHTDTVAADHDVTKTAIVDAVAPAAAPVADAAPAPQVLRQADPAANGGRKEAVFIDRNVAGWQSLVDGTNAGVEVVLLDASQDGLSQMARWAETHQGYDAIHIVSHGNEGSVNLGVLTLDTATIGTRSADLETLGKSLTSGGDLLLYGCQVAGGEGRLFIDSLSRATAADVGASLDVTGSAGSGGNWVLEANAGSVEHGVPFDAATVSAFDTALTAPLKSTTLTFGTTGAVISNTNTNFTASASDIKTESGGSTASGLNVSGTGTSNVTISYNATDAAKSGIAATGDAALTFGTSSEALLSATISSNDGSAFALTSFDWGYYRIAGATDGSVSVTITAHHLQRGTVTVSNTTFSEESAQAFSNQEAFRNIDSFTITFSQGIRILQIDNLLLGNAVPDTGGGDTTPPTVSSIALSGSPAANASSVSYTVTFSEDVSGVDASDFSLAKTGTADGTIGSVTQVSASVYTVSVTGISGAGTLGLNLNGSGTGIQDTANNAIATGSTGPTRTVDTVAPTFDVAAAASGSTSTGFSLSTSLNEAGTVYYVIVADGATAPTSAQIKAGQDSTGSAALKSGSSAATTGSFDSSFSAVTGLTAGTAYDVYFVAEDTLGNLMASPTKVDASTLSSNTDPVIGNLNGDSVAWAGEGQTVLLDTGAAATASDTENGASSWNNSVLTIRRSVSGTATPLVSDIFSFNSNAAFSESGGTLLDSANSNTVFGTVTNTNGTLTVTFNGSATATLIQTVMNNILYRNDTPTGDTVIRYSLTDGNGGSTTADVTVTSDTIYVTNNADAGAIDVSDGVSLREAVAIALADTTGTQTIKFASGLANDTITLGSGLSVTENLTFDADAAGSLTIAGSTITVSTGTVLTLSNGSGDTLTVSSKISGSGAVTKTGAGTATLSGGNDYSGATTIGAGTLTVSGGIGDSSAVTVASGATLELTGSETIGSLTGSGAVTLGGNTLTTGGDNTSTSFDGVVSGTGGLSKAGSGTLTLTGTNSYTGTTTVGAGTLELNSSAGTALADGSAVTVTSGATLKLSAATETIGTLTGVSGATLALGGNALTVKQSTNGTFSGAITGTSSGSLILNADADSRSLTLDGTANSTGFAGGITVTKGWLVATSDSNLGAGTLTLNGGTLRLSGAVGTIDNAIAVGSSGGSISVAPSGSVTLSGAISGSGTLTKTASGNLALSGDNSSFSGAFAINAGTVTVSNANALGSTAGGTTVADGAALSLSGGITIAENLTLSGTGVSSGGALVSASGTNTVSGTVTLNTDTTVTTTSDLTLSGVISGSNGLTKAGSGTLTLSGSNTYTGATTVSAGTLALNSSTGTALADGSAVTVASGATLTLSSASETIGTLSGVSGSTLAIGANALTVSQGSAGTFSGVITGSGSLIKTGNFNLSLGGTTNRANFSGTITIDGAGQLVVGSADALGSGDVTLTNGGELRLSGNITVPNNIVVGTGGGSIAALSGNSSVISGTISGSGALAKTAGGTLTLSGDNSGFTGSMSVNVGILIVSNANALGSTAGGTTVASGAALSLSGGITIAENLTLSGTGVSAGGALISASGTNTVSGTVALAANTTVTTTSDLALSGVVSGAYALTKSGTGSLTLSGSNTYTGATTISTGTLVAGHNNALGTTAGGTTVASGATLAVANGVTLTEALTLSGTGVSSAGALQVTSGSGTVGGAVTMGANTTIGVSGTGLTLSGVVSGAYALTKDGSGMLTLSGDNTYTGATTVSAGVLYITHANALGTTAAGTTVSSGATLRIGNGLTIAENLTISGIGVSSGIGAVKVNGGTATITGTVTLAANADIGSYNSGDTLTISSTVSGAYNLTKVGAGTVVLSGTNGYTGTTTVSNGTLSIAGSGNISSAGITLDGGTLDVTGSAVTLANAIALGSGHGTVSVGTGNALTLSGVISGAYNLTKSGAGTLTLSGTGTYTGTTTVGAGTLVVTGTLNGASAGAVTVGNGGTLAGTGTVNGGLTVQSGGTLSPGIAGTNNGVGTLTVNGGLTIQSGGTLAVDLASTSSYDQVNVTGAVNVGSATLTAGGSYTPVKTVSGDSFAIVTNDGSDAVTGTFNGLASGAALTLNSGSITISYAAGSNSNDVVLTGPANQAPVLGGTFTTAGTVDDNATATPFTNVTVTDADDTTGTFTVTITYTAANGTLSSAGGGLTGTAGNYTLTATTPGDLQTLLRALVFTPTNNQVAPGSTVQTTFSLTASDGVGSSSANTSTVVTASSINDTPTDIALSNSSISIFEGANGVVGTLSATDADTGQTLTYTLVSGTGDTNNALFNISGTSLQATNAATLTGGQSYSVRVRVSDGTATYEKTFSISVTSDLVVDITAIDSNTPVGTYAADKADGGGLDLREAITLANNLTGAITIRFASTLSGTITLPVALTVRSGVTLAMDSDTDSRSITITGNGFTLGSSFDVSVGEGDTLTINSTLADNGTDTAALTKAGTGALVLGGTNNTASGNTGINTITVSAGTLSVAGDANLGTDAVTMAGGTLAVTGATTIDNAIALSSDSSITNPNAVTLSGAITGTGGLTKLDSGKLTLSNAGNSWSGGITLRGEVELGATGTIGSGTITLNGGTLTTTASSQTLTNAIAIGSNDGTVKTANALTLSGIVSGSGALTKTGAGTVTLSGTNTYTGATTVSAGTLRASGGSAIGDGNAVSVGANGTLNLSANETIGSLSGSGAVTLGGYTLTTGGANSDTTFSGVLSGTGGLTKTGSGTLTLTGANSYTGSTTVSAGTLAASGSGTVGSGSAVTVASGATLSSTAASLSLGSLAGDGTVSIGANTLEAGSNDANTGFSGTLSGSGDFYKRGTGTLTLSGTNSSSFTGTMTVRDGGTLSVAGDANLGA
ncbi:autotransporter-associated beta strand repeat-containing protein, partial [Azospirillum palustre]